MGCKWNVSSSRVQFPCNFRASWSTQSINTIRTAKVPTAIPFSLRASQWLSCYKHDHKDRVNSASRMKRHDWSINRGISRETRPFLVHVFAFKIPLASPRRSPTFHSHYLALSSLNFQPRSLYGRHVARGRRRAPDLLHAIKPAQRTNERRAGLCSSRGRSLGLTYFA